MVKKFKNSDQGSTIDGWFEDIATSWVILLISSIIAVILGYIYLFVIRAVGGFIIWASFALIELAVLFCGFYTLFVYRPDKFPDETTDMHKYVSYAGYIIFAIGGIIALVICCCYDAIQIGIAVFKTTSQYISSNMKIFILPALSYICIVIWMFFWFGGAVFVFA